MTAMMTPSVDDGKPFGNYCRYTMIQAMADKSVSMKFKYVNFGIRLRQAIDDIVSPPQYLVKETKTLLETDELLQSVLQAVKTEGRRVMKVTSKRKERIKRFARSSEKTVSVRSSSWNESLPTDISDDIIYQKTYLVTAFNEEECHKKMEDRNHRTIEKQKLKKSESAYKLGQVTILKVIETVNDLF